VRNQPVFQAAVIGHISPVCLNGRLGQKSGRLPTFVNSVANGSVAPTPVIPATVT